MKKKILMVYPEIPATYWSFKYALPFVGYKSLMPPLGLLTVASFFPDGYEIKLIDMNVSQLSWEDIIEVEIVFISAMIVQKNSFSKIVQLCKKCNTPVVAGGPYPTSSYMDIKDVDYFVLNEAEINLPKFLNDYEAGTPRNLYNDGKKPDITKTPPPRFDLIDMSVYSSMALQFSRGCPFNCEFCDIIEMFGRKPRTKLPGQFIHEMEIIFNTGYRGPLFIVDDNFIGNKNKVKELLKRIVAWQKTYDYPYSLFTEASINLAQDDELLDLMVEAGFTMVFVGIETPVPETLRMIQKQHNLKADIHKSIIKIQNKGIEVQGGFIVGFDTDPENIFDLQIEFIQKAGIPMAMVGLMIVLPKTQLYRRLERENRILGNTNGNNTHELELNFIPRMPEQKLINGYKKIISTIYTPVKYFNRCINLIKRIPGKNYSKRPVTKNDLKAFFLSLFKLTFSSYGIHYIRFLIKSLYHNFRNFPLAVNLAIKGYHFFRITNEILKADEFSTMLMASVKSFEKRLTAGFKRKKEISSSKIESYGTKLIQDMKKKYRQFNPEMQNNLKNTFIDFEEYCEKIVSQKKNLLLNKYNDTDRYYNVTTANSQDSSS